MKQLNIFILNFSNSIPITKQIYYLSFYLNPILKYVRKIKIRNITESDLIKLKEFQFNNYNFLSNETYVKKELIEKLETDKRILKYFSLLNLSDKKELNFGFNYNLDVYSNKNATSEMINLSNRFFSTRELLTTNRERYENEVFLKPKSEKILLLGSGPSIDNFDFEKYSDYDIMICNSLVISNRICQLDNIKYIVFGDPIFHSGPSKYAGIFRHTLNRNYKNKDVKIFTPSRDYLLYKYYYSENILNKFYFFGINQNYFNFALNEKFEVKATQNILTLAMLPIAINNYKHIYFAGFDGNSSKNKKYYWKHSEKYQFKSELDDIKNIHPGFFQVDFNDYNKTHNDVLNEILKINSNVSFRNLTKSSIEALDKLNND